MDWLFFNTAQKDSLNYWYLNVWELGDSSSNHANKLISIQKEEENPSSSTSKQPLLLYTLSQSVYGTFTITICMVKESFYNGSLALLDENRFFGKKRQRSVKL